MLYLYHSGARPIWEDIYISTQGTAFANFDAVNFDLLLLTQDYYPTILSGRAVKRPGESYVRVLLNDVIADYLRPRLTNLAGDTGSYIEPQSDGGSEAVHSFQLTWKDPDGNVANANIVFDVFADWSYNRDPNAYAQNNYAAYVRTDPVDRVMDPRQFVLLTTLVGSQLSFQSDDGGTAPGAISNMGDAKAPKTWFIRGNRFSTGHRYFFRLLFPSGTPFSGASYSVTQKIFTVKDTCARYCLYYVNALGGWDSFLIRGRVKESDRITRSEYERRAPSDLLPGNIGQRGRDVLTLAATRAMEMHTHWLSDDEASRMYHLTESTSVYVHDLETDIIYPAVLTNTSHEEKTYKKNGNRLVSYQIDLDLAVPIERR